MFGPNYNNLVLLLQYIHRLSLVQLHGYHRVRLNHPWTFPPYEIVLRKLPFSVAYHIVVALSQIAEKKIIKNSSRTASIIWHLKSDSNDRSLTSSFLLLLSWRALVVDFQVSSPEMTNSRTHLPSLAFQFGLAWAFSELVLSRFPHPQLISQDLMNERWRDHSSTNNEKVQDLGFCRHLHQFLKSKTCRYELIFLLQMF